MRLGIARFYLTSSELICKIFYMNKKGHPTMGKIEVDENTGGVKFVEVGIDEIPT